MIRLVVLYVRFPPSLRNIEDLLFECGSQAPEGILPQTARPSPKRANPGPLLLLAALLIFGHCGLLGGPASSKASARSDAIELKVATPKILRNGMVFETVVEVSAAHVPRVLVNSGEVVDPNMRPDRITRPELESEMGLAGIAPTSEVAWAILEPNGKISFIRAGEDAEISSRQGDDKII